MIAAASAPGAVSLIGEDLEPHGLDALGAAVDLRATVRFLGGEPEEFRLETAARGSLLRASREGRPPAGQPPHLLSTSLEILAGHGVRFSRGARLELSQDATLEGPAGIAARTVALLRMLEALRQPSEPWSAEVLAELAHRVASREQGRTLPLLPFFCTALGGVVHLVAAPRAARRIPAELPELVLGTLPETPLHASPPGPLAAPLAAILARMRALDPALDLRTVSLEEAHALVLSAGVPDSDALWRLLHLRDLTCAALHLLEQPALDRARLGELLNEYETRRADLAGAAAPGTRELRRHCLEAGALGVRTRTPGEAAVVVLADPPASSFVERVSAPPARLATLGIASA